MTLWQRSIINTLKNLEHKLQVPLENFVIKNVRFRDRLNSSCSSDWRPNTQWRKLFQNLLYHLKIWKLLHETNQIKKINIRTLYFEFRLCAYNGLAGKAKREGKVFGLSLAQTGRWIDQNQSWNRSVKLPVGKRQLQELHHPVALYLTWTTSRGPGAVTSISKNFSDAGISFSSTASNT